MPLRCKIAAVDFDMGEIWANKEDFESLSPEQMRELVAEDILAFLESIPDGILFHSKFYWSDDE